MPGHGKGHQVSGVCLLLIAFQFFLTLAVSGSDHVVVPMCGEVRGFAGESNHLLRIGVPKPPGDGEAIVLIVRPFPMNTEGVSERLAQINATYRLREGATATSVSDDAGILLLRNVEAGTNIDVEIRRVRPDGPVPFRFWSYHANNPSCFISVSPHTSFISPIPTSLGQPVLPAKIYFQAVPMEKTKAVMLRLADGPLDGGKPQHFHLLKMPEAQDVGTHESSKVMPWNSSVLYFSFVPAISANKVMSLSVGVVWTADDDGGSGSGQASDPNATDGSGNSKDKKGHSASFYFFLITSLFAVYMVIMSVVNYRLKGITQFPEMVPHIDTFRTGGQFISQVAENFRQGNMRGDYNDVGGKNAPAGNV
ncbi:Autophagy-related protein 27, putative [Trypanosoma equiperdum]|uniref:Autophagy-related protein 27 n=3 Tax=Trypanozoon TaxID=39700 RepID=Q585Z2_TRYB2|nr:hypothetical protein, conserved [Trypanosoma brucei brucei TREU927]AAX80766.1 hypothetical protein, conserved [Trypanosoma brucei]AAZ11953.1 hypothetical protein, conserved [Trypanosoma brucei brucei TREU927]SCU68127.1 Autophagy-related protein 27, putative [Trypanosoma equiperdum]